MSLLNDIKMGRGREIIEAILERERISKDLLVERLLKGEIVIVKNRNHKNIKPLAIGKGLKTKINANIGSSREIDELDMEINKGYIAKEAGADTIMDLSTGRNIKEIRKKILELIDLPLGTVPIYDVAASAYEKEKSFVKMEEDEIFDVIYEQARLGVDFMTVHCGVTLETFNKMKREGRILDVVSRGGALIVEWMKYNKKENPLFERFDDILKIASEFDVVLSLGDGFRPGAIADATDRAQIYELIILGELQQRALEKGVQVMIEGPGHVPLDQIETNIRIQKELCHNAPFYVLGPLVTDCAPGYDHIVAAIGGALAGYYGADFLCYVTPAEHLKLPDLDDVREGVIASKIAAHAADIAKGIPGAIERDIEMSKARAELNWEKMYKYAIDPKKAKTYREKSIPKELEDVCTMCGPYCAIKVQKDEK
ncbi:MAG: phosphomethylpyrimidine synthase ThiC [Deltaproteobacteria bacterium]|nr:phosphomethylpyrimidine synthase ThiC [Deltaproteobacteria bacterium]